jgi:transposase
MSGTEETMRIDYQQAIRETSEELAAQERKVRGRPVAVRVRMLHLLKSGHVPSLAQGAPLLGYSQTQLTRWWEQYQRQGLAALLVEQPRGGKTSRLTAEARIGLEETMKRGEIATLREVQRYLQEEWDISYRSLNGIWWQLRQHQIKLKTGRRRHKQADKEAQQTFKAGFRRNAPAAQGGAELGL